MKKTIYIRLLTHLVIVIILITLLIGFLVYQNTNSILKEQALSHNSELLGQTEKIVTQAMGEVEQLAISLALNSDINKSVLFSWDLRNEYEFLKNTSDLFTDRLTSSKYLHSILLYSSTNQKLISNSGITNLNEYNDQKDLQSVIHNHNRTEWKANKIVNSNGKSENVISFYTSLPISSQEKKGILVINLKEDVLYKAVINTNNKKLGNVVILDNEGKVLSSTDKSMFLKRFDQVDIGRIKANHHGYFIEDIKGANTLVSFQESKNGWIYLTLNPYKEVVKRSSEVIYITLSVTLTTLIIGILLIIFVSSKHYQPIRKIVEDLNKNKNSFVDKSIKDEFSFIRTSIDHLFKENNEFKIKFKNSELILRDHVILNLLSGTNLIEKEILQQVQHYKINLSHKSFIVLVLRSNYKSKFDNDQQVIDLFHYKLRSLCEEIIELYGGGVYISDFHKQDVIIMNSDSLNSETIKEMALYMKKIIDEQFPMVSISIGIGGKYNGLSEISLSYTEAKEALVYKWLAGEGSILSFNEIQINHLNRNELIEYRKMIESIENELKAGNIEKACQIKENMISKLKNDSQFGYLNKKMILTHLLNSLAIISVELIGNRENEYDSLYVEFEKLQNLDEIQIWFEEVMTNISSNLQDKRENKNVEVINTLTEYIHNNFREPISLQILSDIVYMNSHYLSKLFKDVTGKNFSDYLLDIRLKEAMTMLKATSKNIVDIASETGFGHKQNFIRNFKKHTGLTPTEYRKQSFLESATSQSE
ncbi:helix-turn-helix domain-containing protein [Lederbergia wuyishanensis]|uniref:YesN/AraC family two-component response regulator n=1 Tax=Lederbergia wuyishanensis TaxID=1347903 RepID=A0ABU0D7H6_9BACI|nr:helix-turn-helix domain-containing protein [Lederbergia wuyishanensis]MCJ8009013.1 helix-turn-helix domain-containing protein [Lederbergia wuyishanensis]MDQ0344345.1 YesN/AraC family two-component response regulator [Lederbergia wuyishanensis]